MPLRDDRFFPKQASADLFSILCRQNFPGEKLTLPFRKAYAYPPGNKLRRRYDLLETGPVCKGWRDLSNQNSNGAPIPVQDVIPLRRRVSVIAC